MPEISIIVPVYNVESYLHRCLESIINQSFKDIEIILVNDGSTDKSPLICEEYLNKDCRVKLINKKNGGLSSARNAGMKVATGKYIGFVDSDDWIEYDMYEHLYHLIIDTDSDVADIQSISTSKPINIKKRKEEILTYEGKEILLNYLKVGQYSVWRKLYNKKVLENIEFPEGKINEDIATNFKILKKACKIVKSNQVKYYYFNNTNSISTGGFKHKDLDLLDACNELVELAKQENYKNIEELAKVKLARSYFSLLSKIAIYGIKDETINKCDTVNFFSMKVKESYLFLIKSSIPFSRKILITIACINYNLFEIILKKMGRYIGI